MSKLGIIIGSPGNNKDLAEKINEVALKVGFETELIDLVDLDLPLYSTTKEKEGIPAQAKELTAKFIAMKGFIFLAPEYNGSMPPAVNNAVAWISRSGGEDWRGAFNGKLAIVGTHSGGGGHKVVEAMRKQLEHLGCNVLARPIITNYGKEFNPESGESILTQMITLIK